MTRSAVRCFALILALIGGKTENPIGASLLRRVEGIEGKSHEGRNAFIKTQLDSSGIGYDTMPFDTVVRRGSGADTIHGENIIVAMGKGSRTIILGAHYDAVPGAPGANDNGGGVAVLLGLLVEMRSHPFRHKIDFVFFDQEERGLLGSAVFVRRSRHTHLAMVNLDVEGTGNEVYIGPVGGGDDNRIMKHVRRAEKETEYHCVEDSVYPGSDHESFARAGLENISISIVPEGDSKKLARWVKSGYRQLEEGMPQVLRVMHSPEDKSEYMTPSALAMSYTFTKEVLLSLDEEEE